MNSNWSYSPETPNLGQIRRFLEPCDLEILRMTLKNNRAPLLRYFKLCASFSSHLCILTGVTVRKPPIWVKFDDFFSRVTLKFDGCPWKTIGHLFHATSSFVHDFIAICEFKLKLESGKKLWKMVMNRVVSNAFLFVTIFHYSLVNMSKFPWFYDA